MSVALQTPREFDMVKTFKDAEGITKEGKKDTNHMLAERDYDVACRTGTEALLVVQGCWIWFCWSHAHPLWICDMERQKIKSLVFAEAVKLNDKTVPYEYGGYSHRDASKNAAGVEPAQFQRWLTPKEMALDFIRDLKN